MEALPEAGALQQHPLPRLLVELYQAGFSGTLELHRRRISKRIELRQGHPLRAESNREAESLGQILKEEGELREQDLPRLAAEMRSRSIGEAEAIAALRLVEARPLLAALQIQLRLCLLDAFAWDDGEFKAVPGASAAAGTAVGIDPLPLVRDGLESRWSVERILGELGENLGRFPQRAPEADSLVERLRGDAGVDGFLDAMDGRQRLMELLQAGGAAAAATAWVLDALGLLSYAETPPSSAPDGPDPAPEIEIVIAGRRSAAPQGPRADAQGKEAVREAAEDAEAAALRREVNEKHERLAEIDHFELLGVSRNAKTSEIRRAYVQAAKRFHPDALTRLGLHDLKHQANEVFAALARAQATLCDADQRADYEASLSGEAGPDANRLAQAEMLYRKAQVLLRAGQFSAALELLEPCVELWPEESAYQTELGWALFKQPRPDLVAARAHLVQAVELDEENALAHHRLHLLLRALGDEAGSRRARAHARRLDPSLS
jgi:hypothetical protein